MKRILALAAILGSACGAAPREFPVGIFGVETPEAAKAAKEAGFDAIQSYRRAPAEVAAVAAAARSNGQLLLVSPDEMFSSTYSARAFPGVYWYLRDEPDLVRWTAAQLKERERLTVAWAPGAKTAFVVGDGRKAKDYPGVADAIMVDWYPVPHLPLESAGDMVRLTAEAAGGRTVWAVLQAFDWRGSPQHDPTKPRIGRMPAPGEIRFMSYDAVLNGAQGVWYFSYSTEAVAAAGATAREMRDLAPVFMRGRPIPLPFPFDPEGLEARAWTYHGRDYVVLVNRTRGRDLLVPAVLLESRWRPLFEPRRDPREALRNVEGEYYLPQYQVLVLESRLRPSRILGR